MEKRYLKIFLILASIAVFLFACITSLLTINYYNRKVQCLYNGSVYQNGASFDSADKCNLCNCNNGSVVCTLRACAKPDVEGLITNKVNIYCYDIKNVRLYSILPSKIYNDKQYHLSSPVDNYADKTREEAEQILLKDYKLSSDDVKALLDNCSD